MAKYIITYIGGKQPATPEEGQQHMAKYKEWLASLGDAAISPANPFKETKTISPDGNVSAGSSTQMSGYTIIDVPSMEVALEISKACPFLAMDGTLEVSELMEMPG